MGDNGKKLLPSKRRNDNVHPSTSNQKWPKTGVERIREYRHRKKFGIGCTRTSKSTAQYQHEYRERKKEKIGSEPATDDAVVVNNDYIVPIYTGADAEFHKRFTLNPFGSVCSVCDRLWFLKDVRKYPAMAKSLLEREFPNDDVSMFVVCASCYKSLHKNKIPRLSRSNGFVYPPIPTDLPPLDPIAERLISPRLPFMQIRRLRRVVGAKCLIGQVINVPIEVNNMVSELPRQLDDDYAFNVAIKRHQIHKSSAYEGYVTKGVVKAWLRYLITTPLYRENNITIDPEFLKESVLQPLPDETVNDIEIIDESQTAQALLIAKQHTMLWNEDKILSLAPGMNRKVVALCHDKYAEELSFPSIYLGQKRIFTVLDLSNETEDQRYETTNTVYAMATSEMRRQDRRGVKPEHVLYVAMKVMRLRLADSLQHVFKSNSDIRNLTRENLEDRSLMETMVETNFSFLRAIPNSVHYWASRKKDLFAMIRQLGKPTFFLTMSALEYEWNDLLRLLYKLENNGKEWVGEGEPETSISSHDRTTLVNEDPVTCCLYFNKLIDAIMDILAKPSISPFGEYYVVDWFKRIEFQQRGSPHTHILLWLANDQRESVSEDMPETVRLIDVLCSIDTKLLQRPHRQIHKHTFTCYKKCTNEEKVCRFGAPFWPMTATHVLVPLPQNDGRRQKLRETYADMHHGLEFGEFDTLESLWAAYNVYDEEHYLNVIRAGITRPRVFLKRTIEQKFINPFNPWIAKILRSNTDLQYILEEYSCATYVVEYVNKTNRGISDLNRELCKLRDEYPDLDFAQLSIKAGIKLLDSVEISCQEAAWYLLNLHMSEASRKCTYIPTTWPHERYCVAKRPTQMDYEGLAGDSTDVWCENMIDKYQKRQQNLEHLTLAQFVANYSKNTKGEWRKRQKPQVIRYTNYDCNKKEEYKREMCLLHIPFRNEELEFLDQKKFLQIYEEREEEIINARREFEACIDIQAVMEECRKLFAEEDEQITNEDDNEKEYTASKEVHEDFVKNIRDNVSEDMIAKIMEKMSAIVRKRENVLTAAQYCAMMRQTNLRQRELILEVIHRLFLGLEREPIQIFFSGPAGCGKTFTMRAMMETYNRFAKTHNDIHNAFIACASTGVTAAALGGTTVHSVFCLSNNANATSLSMETLNKFRTAFANVRVIFIDECSMIGAKMLSHIDTRLKNIMHNFEVPFGGQDMVFCGDLRQLPPVRQTAIYKRISFGFAAETVWHSLKYYQLNEVMRQANKTFSALLTKIGNGDALTAEEKEYIERRFISTEEINKEQPTSIRLFHTNTEINDYHSTLFNSPEMISYIAEDVYAGAKTNDQLTSARTKVFKMGLDETSGLPYKIDLLKEKPYMLRVNIDVSDGLVNGAIGLLKHIEHTEKTNKIIRLWLLFDSQKVGNILRSKALGHYGAFPHIDKKWTPIALRSSTISLPSKVVTCKRTTFPLSAACAISIHKSQGSTYSSVVYEYSKLHDQQLVYVALSRCSSYENLFLTNKNRDYKFYHVGRREFKDIRTEFTRLERHKLITHAALCREKVIAARATVLPAQLTLCTFNVQSLAAHVNDLTTDYVIGLCGLLILTETWLADNKCDEFVLPGYTLISHYKRNNQNMAGGVAIYQKNQDKMIYECKSQPLLKIDPVTRKVEEIHIESTAIGDMCTAEATIGDQRELLVAAYLSNKSTLEEKKKIL